MENLHPHTPRSAPRVRRETAEERQQRHRDQLDAHMAIYRHYCQQASLHPDPDVRWEMLMAVNLHLNPGHVPHVGAPRRLDTASTK